MGSVGSLEIYYSAGGCEKSFSMSDMGRRCLSISEFWVPVRLLKWHFDKEAAGN